MGSVRSGEADVIYLRQCSASAALYNVANLPDYVQLLTTPNLPRAESGPKDDQYPLVIDWQGLSESSYIPGRCCKVSM
jgi:hypothetical protein